MLYTFIILNSEPTLSVACHGTILHMVKNQSKGTYFFIEDSHEIIPFVQERQTTHIKTSDETKMMLVLNLRISFTQYLIDVDAHQTIFHNDFF